MNEEEAFTLSFTQSRMETELKMQNTPGYVNSRTNRHRHREQLVFVAPAIISMR